MSEVSSYKSGPTGLDRKHYASGGIEFHNRMRALDNYHNEMQAKINMLTKKMEAKQANTEKFREVRKKELDREIEELEENYARAKLDHHQKLKRLNEGIDNGNHVRVMKEVRKDLNNNKLQFMRDLYNFDPRWKDKLRAKKQMHLQRLEHKRTQLQAQVENVDDEVDRELDHQIKDAKFDIYKLQKHADIKRHLLYSDQKEGEPEATLFKEIHKENRELSDQEKEEIIKDKFKEEQKSKPDKSQKSRESAPHISEEDEEDTRRYEEEQKRAKAEKERRERLEQEALESERLGKDSPLIRTLYLQTNL